MKGNYIFSCFLKVSCNVDKFFMLYGSRASDFGLMKIDETGRIIQFSEKPKDVKLEAMVSIDT